MSEYHLPVLLRETIDALAVRPDGIYVDGTAGGGGHSAAIASRLTTGRLIALDRDPDAIREASARLQGLPAEVVQANFADMEQVLAGARYREGGRYPAGYRGVLSSARRGGARVFLS